MKKIRNIAQYVQEGIENGSLIPEKYVKNAVVKAVPGIVGQKVQTTMKNGLFETSNVVAIDENSGRPDWIVTNPSGEAYIVKDSIFCEKYAETTTPGVYQAKGNPVTCVKVAEDISFVAPWGEVMFLGAGGMLNISSMDDIYGIQATEFHETYKKVEGLH